MNIKFLIFSFVLFFLISFCFCKQQQSDEDYYNQHLKQEYYGDSHNSKPNHYNTHHNSHHNSHYGRDDSQYHETGGWKLNDGDTYSETYTEGWGERIGNSVGGAVVGFILFIGSFIVLWWNEGRSVRRAQSLKEGRDAVVEAQPNNITNSNENQLVHLNGKTQSKTGVLDETFQIRDENALRMKREVEMYQWKETVTTTKKKNVGGSQNVTKSYRYNKVWSSSLINSNNFKEKSYSNPSSLPFSSSSIDAQDITVGEYKLSDSLVGSLSTYVPFQLKNEHVYEMPIEYRNEFQVHDNSFYRGNPLQPQLGDIRIRFKIVESGAVSIVAKQQNNSLVPYTTSNGGSIALIEQGSVSADQMFSSAESASAIITWIFRGVGWFLMGLGMTLIAEPLGVIADVLPFLGTILRIGTTFATFIASAVLSLLTIAIAWLRFRPVLSLTLFAIIVCLIIVQNSVA